MLKLVFAFLLMTTSAIAADIDFSTVILDADNKPILDNGQELTLGLVSLRAATAPFEDEKNLTGEDKFKRAELAMRVYKGGVVSLTVEEVALLKRLIAKGYGPLIVLRTWSILEGKDQQKHEAHSGR